MNHPRPLPHREFAALRALDDMSHRSPDAVREETLRVRAKLIELYGWEGFQRVMARMESDLAQLEREYRASGN